MGLLNDPFFRYPASVFPHYMRTTESYGGPYGAGPLDGMERERTGFSEVANDKDKFVVKMDVSHFKPEDLKVKTVDNWLIIEAIHEEKRDEHGFIKRSFSHRYMIPEGVDVSTLQSSLHRDGILTIQTPKKPAIGGPPSQELAIEAPPRDDEKPQVQSPPTNEQ